MYACVYDGDIYKQTNATGNFVALGQTARYWKEICQVNNDVYACAYEDIYKQTGVKTGTHNKLHTVEGISGNVVTVNYEHASNRGNGSLKLINAHEVPSTFTRIAKWYNAPIGLGQAWVDVKAVYETSSVINTTNRTVLGFYVTMGNSDYNYTNATESNPPQNIIVRGGEHILSIHYVATPFSINGCSLGVGTWLRARWELR